MKKKILLTGASGFVGSQILQELLKYDLEIYLIIRESSKKKIKINKKIKKIYFTKNLFKEKNSWFDNITKNIDIIIHAALYVKEKNYMTSKYNLNCLNGTKKLANFCKKNKIKKFIGLGTCLEYDVSHKYLSINAPLKPKSLYAKTKTETYKYLVKCFHNSTVKFNWCRLFYLYGDNQPEKKLYTSLNSNLRKNNAVIIKNGNQVRDFIHVKVAARIIVNNSLKKTYEGPINVCSGNGVTVKEFAIKIAKRFNKIHLLKFSKSKDKKNSTDIIVGVI